MRRHLALKLIVALLLAVAPLAATQVQAADDATGTASVTFTGKALNPRDPTLPLTGGGGTTSGNSGHKAEPTVVVTTKAEKTKVKTAQTATKTTAATTQTRLPQTGSVTLPAAAVIALALVGLGLAGWTLRRDATLAE
ncbi:LPXTG cell wall anchor domain-containing protein [Lacticaseibacillus suihuaensis]